MEISISQMMNTSGLEAAASRIQQLQVMMQSMENPPAAQPTGAVTSVRGTFKNLLQQATPSSSGAMNAGAFEPLVDKASKTYGLDKDLLLSVIRQESGFNPDAVSKAGAQGLMQLMPGTAEKLGVSQPLDPVQNIDGGARYLKGLLDQFHGNVPLALAAYNAGSNAVRKYQGIPPYAETQQYVRSILAMYLKSKQSNS